MKSLTVRLEDYDYERADLLAKRAGLSVPAHIRAIYKRELDGIDSASVIREELERERAAMRADGERFQNQLLEIVVALRDSLYQSNDALLDGFKDAIAGKTGGRSDILSDLRRHRNQS